MHLLSLSHTHKKRVEVIIVLTVICVHKQTKQKKRDSGDDEKVGPALFSRFVFLAHLFGITVYSLQLHYMKLSFLVFCLFFYGASGFLFFSNIFVSISREKVV